MSLSVTAAEYELDVTQVKLEHAWRGPNNVADFNDTVYGVGLTTWHNNTGLRLGYIKGKDLNTSGRYSRITIKLKHILSAELLYKYDIDNLRLYGGIGWHWIPVPMYWEGIAPNSHAATDADNDHGYILGFQYKMSKHLSVGYRFTHYSRIKIRPYDEWTKGNSFNLTYIF